MIERVESLLLGMDKGVWSSEVRFLSFKVKVLFYGGDFLSIALYF